MKYIVYLTTNLINGKIYVGEHGTEDPYVFDGYIGNAINIFKSNSSYLTHPKLPFHKAVKKYGYNAFRRSTIQVFDTEEEALHLEGIIVDEEFIKRKDTYNVALGGGRPPRADKIIYQYSLEGEFIKEWNSALEAERILNVNATAIGHAALYKKTSQNYLWSFEKMPKLNVEEYNVYNPKIPVYLYDNDKLYLKSYESMSECCKDLNTDLSRVQRAARLGNKINDYYLSLTLSGIFIEPKFETPTGDVHQYNLDGTYIRSYTDKKGLYKELKDLGFDLYEINRAIKMDKTYKQCTWLRGYKFDSVEPKEYKINKIRKIGQYTMDGDLVKIFNTVRECRKEFPNVSKVLNGSAKHCHNFTFKYLE